MSDAAMKHASINLHDMPCDLRALDLAKGYGDFSLGPLSMGVPERSVVGLIGQNGAGKTTLMKLLLGIVHADAGSVQLFGRDAASMSNQEFAACKERIGYVGAVCAYPQAMTVREVMRMHAFAYPRFSQEHFDKLAKQMGLLPGSAQKKVSELSRGMGMKLQLCCALACGVDLLIMDEPTAGLDPVVREEVLDIVRTWMAEGPHSALISSHITSDLEHLADYLVLINEGIILMSCERDAVFEMGVARLRTSELERVLADGFIANARFLRHDLSLDLLVPSRAAFAAAYPDYACDPATIDDVMVLLVKGEAR